MSLDCSVTYVPGPYPDVGYFLVATQTSDGLAVDVKSKEEHYKGRTWTFNIARILVGLLLFVVPGVLLSVWYFVLEPRLNNKQIDRVMLPPLSVFLGARKQ